MKQADSGRRRRGEEGRKENRHRRRCRRRLMELAQLRDEILCEQHSYPYSSRRRHSAYAITLLVSSPDLFIGYHWRPSISTAPLLALGNLEWRHHKLIYYFLFLVARLHSA